MTLVRLDKFIGTSNPSSWRGLFCLTKSSCRPSQLLSCQESCRFDGRDVGCEEISSPSRQQPVAREIDRLLRGYFDLLELSVPGRRIIDQMGASQK